MSRFCATLRQRGWLGSIPLSERLTKTHSEPIVASPYHPTPAGRTKAIETELERVWQFNGAGHLQAGASNGYVVNGTSNHRTLMIKEQLSGFPHTCSGRLSSFLQHCRSPRSLQPLRCRRYRLSKPRFSSNDNSAQYS